MADFLERLHEAGELARIEQPVDPCLEAAQITCRTAASSGTALLFGSVAGHDMPLVTNLLGREGRVLLALDARSLDAASARVAEALDPSPGHRLLGGLGFGGKGGSKALAPRLVRSGACQQVVRLGSDVDLARLPAIRWGPDQQAPAITAGQVHSVAPETASGTASGRRAVARYDLLVLGRDRLAIGWLAQDDHARLLAEYRRRKERMPVAVVLGGEPAGLLAAMAPLPGDVDGVALAGLLRGAGLDLVACRSVDLAVPAEADVVLEGYVDPLEPPAAMGPLAGPLGCERAPRPAPVLHVTAVTHRPNPVFPAMVPVGPGNELVAIGRAMLRVCLPALRAAVPGLVDLDLPEFGAARHWGLASIRKTHAGQARQAAGALWALRPAMFCKVLVVVDEEVDVRDAEQVWAAVAAHADPGRDAAFQDGPADPFDPAAAPGRLARRMVVDATAKLSEERHAR